VLGYTTIEVDIGGDEGDGTEIEGPQDAAAVQAHGRLEQTWVKLP
jgi:hypothetical protein